MRRTGRRAAAGILALALLTALLSACQEGSSTETEESESGYKIYYLNQSETAVDTVDYEPSGSGTEELISEFLEQLADEAVPLVIRPARPEDAQRCAAIEAACFPPEQAASLQAMEARIAAYPGHVLLGERKGQVVGFCMGPAIGQPTIEDEMFADVGCHSGENPYQSVFSLAVHPDFQRRGYGRLLLNALIQQARREHRLAVTLTCREHKIAYYESFGFKNLGLAASVHGGVPWYDMYLPLEEGSPA